MKKKEFKLALATNPALYQWMMENAMMIKSKPEIMAYLRHHPDALKHFRPGQTVDNERLLKSAQSFIQEAMNEKMDRKKEKQKPAAMEKESEPKEKKQKKGLFSNIKSMLPSFNGKPAPVLPANIKLPMLQPPGARAAGRRPVAGKAHPQLKPQGKASGFRLPKIKINRRKMMDTLNQTTEMLDVVAALMGKVSNMK